jgi:hypothetical protein
MIFPNLFFSLVGEYKSDDKFSEEWKILILGIFCEIKFTSVPFGIMEGETRSIYGKIT